MQSVSYVSEPGQGRRKRAKSESLCARAGRGWIPTLFGLFPFLQKLFADSAYQGPLFHKALAKILPQLKTGIVRRCDQAKGFAVLPKRWIVERSIAWLNRCRRLAKDWENATTAPSHSSASPLSGSCSENFVILHKLSRRTLRTPRSCSDMNVLLCFLLPNLI